jgi:putative RecB family exonuclease
VAKSKKDIKLSATRINTFLRCKLKYWFNYHEHLPKLTNPSFKLGIAVHEALERAGQLWMEKGFFSEEDKKTILKLYDEVSVREGIFDYSIHKEGKELLKNRLNNFELGKGIINLEYSFGMNGCNNIVTEEGVPLIGAIDKVSEADEDTLLIVDYKTSKTAPTYDDLKSDIQLSIYDLVAHMKWPNYKRIILALDLLKSDILYTYRTEEEREEFKKYLKVIYDSMLKFTKKDAKASLNMFCPWCDYKDYCDTYKKACKKSDYKFLQTLDLSDEELVAEWKNVRDTKKILENRERELSMIMIEKIKKEGSNIYGEEEEVYIRQNSRTNYDTDVVAKLIPNEEFVKMANLNKKVVEGYMDSNPVVKREIENSASVNYTTPFLATKKVKKSKKNK